MAGIFRDGFDSYASALTVVGFAAKYSNVTSSPVSSTITPFAVGRSLFIDTAGRRLTGTFDAAAGSFTLHGMIHFTAFGTSSTLGILQFLTSGTTQVTVSATTNGVIFATRDVTNLGSSAINAVLINTWHAIAIEVVISDTVGRVTVYIDGASVLNLTGQDTANGAVLTCNQLLIGSASGGTSTFYLDDLYITDSATRLTNHPRIETLVPNADGTPLNWVRSTGTLNYATIDELPVATVDFNSASVVGDADEMGLTDLSVTPTSIEEVCIVMYASKTDATARTLFPGVKSGATTSDGTAVTLNATGIRYERPLATDPNTAAAWTTANVNALLVRPKVAS